jgi:ADP-heptose:LPS heptosyltransferase
MVSFFQSSFMILNFRKGSAYANEKAREYLKNKNPDEIQNIAVIRHAAIGDFMNIRPFLIELKNYFPNARITLSVLRSTLYGLPRDLVDDIHIIDKDDPKDVSKKTGFFTRIKQAKTLPPQEIIFDLTDSTLTAFLLFFSKAHLKIGYPYRRFRRLFLDMAVHRSDFVVEAESTLHMLNFLGLPKVKKLNYGFEKKYPKNNSKALIYFAGASTKGKCWEEYKFTALIEKMAAKYPHYTHVILQGIREDEHFEAVYAPLKEKKNILLQKAMELDATMQFLSNARCVIANDTGIRNMAIAVETPTIGIFFGTGAFRYWPNDPIHDCVFNNRYESPDIEAVFTATSNLIDILYK